jgi:hypothetical protein
MSRENINALEKTESLKWRALAIHKSCAAIFQYTGEIGNSFKEECKIAIDHLQKAKDALDYLLSEISKLDNPEGQ